MKHDSNSPDQQYSLSASPSACGAESGAALPSRIEPFVRASQGSGSDYSRLLSMLHKVEPVIYSSGGATLHAE